MTQDTKSPPSATTLDPPLKDSPIARLPLEILILILQIVHSTTADSDIADTRYRQLVPYTLQAVCGFWRDAVLQTPSLWSVVDFTSREAINLSITRAKSYPLHLYLNSPHIVQDLSPILQQSIPCTCPPISNVQTTGSTIETLSVCLPKGAEDVLRYIDTNLPGLQKLKITLSDGLFLELPTNLSPSLKDVRITNVFPRSLRQSGLSNLCVLHIMHSGWTLERGKVPTIDDIIGLLSNCPKLEDLSLGSIDKIAKAWFDHDDHGPTREPISLEHLKKLYLCLKTKMTRRIFSRLIIPRDTQIVCAPLLNGLGPYPDFGTMLPHRIPGLMLLPELRSVFLTCPSSEIFHAFYYRKICTPGYGVFEHPDLTLRSLRWPRHPSTACWLFHQALKMPFLTPATQVKDIHIAFWEFRVVPNWTAIFGEFVGITSLCLKDYSYIQVEVYDSLLALGPKTFPSGSFILPNLCELRLAGVSVDVKFSEHVKDVLRRRALRLAKPLSLLSIDPKERGVPWPGPALESNEVERFFYHSDGVHGAPACTCPHNWAHELR